MADKYVLAGYEEESREVSMYDLHEAIVNLTKATYLVRKQLEVMNRNYETTNKLREAELYGS
jgi:hypothetical protein